LPNPRGYVNDADFNDLVFVAATQQMVKVRLQDAGRVTEGQGVVARFKAVLLNQSAVEENIYYATKFDKSDNSTTLLTAGASDFAQSQAGDHISIPAGQTEGWIEIAVPSSGDGAEFSEEFLVVIANAPNGYIVPMESSTIVQDDSADYTGLTRLTPTGRAQIAEHGLANNPWQSEWGVRDSADRTNTQVESLGYWRATQEGDDVTVTTPKGNPWTSDPGKNADLMNSEGPYLHTVADDYTDFRMVLEYSAQDSEPHNPLPVGDRKDAPTPQWPARPVSNEQYGNSGVYIFDRYEVQIIDPSAWGVQKGDAIGGANQSQLTPGGAYKVNWDSPQGGDPDYDPQGKPTYGFIYNFVNRANPTGQWNKMVIEFHAPTLDAQGDITIPAHLTVWLNPEDPDEPTDAELVFKGWMVDANGAPVRGTGSRAGDKVKFPALDAGAIFLQSHWGSQVEFRAPSVTTIQ